MKKILFTSIALTLINGLSLRAQISDLPVNANPTTICSGESSTVTLTGSESNIKYSLRNSANAVVDGPYPGTGNDITFNTGNITNTETFNVYGEDDYNAVAFNGTNQNIVNLGSDNRGVNANGVSVAMWVKTTAAPATEQFFASKYTPSRGYIMSMDMNGKIRKTKN